MMVTEMAAESEQAFRERLARSQEMSRELRELQKTRNTTHLEYIPPPLSQPKYRADGKNIVYYQDIPVTVFGRFRNGNSWMYDVRTVADGERIDSVPEVGLSQEPPVGQNRS